MKFKVKNKGFIAQGFGGNPDLYASLHVAGHTGVDYVKGYGKLHQADNTGYVYKVFLPKERDDRWVGVYMLVPNGKDYMEVIMGHFSKVFVKEGDTVLEGQYVGAEGNSGYVFSGNTEITPAMQDAGDVRGAHVHEAYRPVRLVEKMTKGRQYLTDHSGKTYKDAKGYYEIINVDAMKGYIDPMKYASTETIMDKIRSITNAVLKLKQ